MDTARINQGLFSATSILALARITKRYVADYLLALRSRELPNPKLRSTPQLLISNKMQYFKYQILSRTTHPSKTRHTLWDSRSSHNKRAAARLPEGIRIYAIGDIHGCADLLEALLLQIDMDCTLYPSRRPIAVFLGDYIDRGPASREVLDLLLGCERTKEAVFLNGTTPSFIAF
jgi:hypothetical protein